MILSLSKFEAYNFVFHQKLLHYWLIDEMKIYKSGDSYSYRRVTVNRQWDDKMYFFPIPQSEKAKNPNLTQNPGW